MPTELHWHVDEPRFTIRSALISFVVHFTSDHMVVDAELTLAARVLATRENRASAVKIIETVANELGL